MKERKRFVVYVDTSYLTYMPAAEKADWNRLLTFSKECVGDLNLEPQLEIHISEIALCEYRSKMIDELKAKIEQTKSRIQDLQKVWIGNELAKELDNPFPLDRDIFPNNEEIESKADLVIQKLLGGIRRIETQDHHGDAVWDKYFKWEPPFDGPSVSQRDDRNIRDNRRRHIPDAWILEAAIDAKKNGQQMLCLCKDDGLSAALEAHGHQAYKDADGVLQALFPPESIELELIASSEAEPEIDDQGPLERLLSKALNPNSKQIYLRLLGFVAVLDTPTHDDLIEAVVTKGFDRKLTEACAVILSDKSKPYIKDTGSHYIVEDKEVCEAAADLLTEELAGMLEK